MFLCVASSPALFVGSLLSNRRCQPCHTHRGHNHIPKTQTSTIGTTPFFFFLQLLNAEAGTSAGTSASAIIPVLGLQWPVFAFVKVAELAFFHFQLESITLPFPPFWKLFCCGAIELDCGVVLCVCTIIFAQLALRDNKTSFRQASKSVAWRGSCPRTDMAWHFFFFLLFDDLDRLGLLGHESNFAPLLLLYRGCRRDGQPIMKRDRGVARCKPQSATKGQGRTPVVKNGPVNGP